ncbi:translocation/assembly module TamB domain-containing protein [Maribacter chungangensis]|uniref:Translocation/assembly module TamB domain-containing protein n=1 Tax=Maribacter chungangensis TaxID=1069117 RepID=A0ABW3B4Y9_9FLAO
MSKKKSPYRIVKRIVKILAVFLLFFVLILLFIRSPWGQGIIVDKLISYITDKTGTQMTVDKLFLTYSGDLEVEGLYIEDMKKDTLLYSKNLQVDLGLTSLIFENTLQVEDVAWQGVVTNIERAEDNQDFNFIFLLEAFSPTETATTAENSKPLRISVGKVNLSNFKVNYRDEFLGIQSQNTIGQLNTVMETIDLQNNIFYFEEITLSDSKIDYHQTKGFPIQENDTTSSTPQLKFSRIKVDNLRARYRSVPNKMDTKAEVEKMVLGIPVLDIASNSYTVDGLSLENSKFSLVIDKVERQPIENSKPEPSTPFLWPDYRIDITDIKLNNNQFTLQTPRIDSLQKRAKPYVFNAHQIRLKVPSFSYRPKNLTAAINQFTFYEKSKAFALKEFRLQAQMDDKSLKISDISVKTSNSNINGAVQIDYSSLEQVMNTPEKSAVDIRLPSFTVAIADVTTFQPALATNPMLSVVSQNPIDGQLVAKGSLEKMLLSDSKVSWGNDTALAVEGTLHNITNIDSLRIDFDMINATSSRADISRFIAITDASLTLPENVQLTGNLSGRITDLNTNVTLASSFGSASFEGSCGLSKTPFIKGQITVEQFQLGKLLNNPDFGQLSVTAETSLAGARIDELSADVIAKVSQFDFKGYSFNTLSANGTVQNGKGALKLVYEDDHLNLTSNTLFELGSNNYDIQSETNLQGAELQALGLAQKNIRVGADLNLNFQGSLDNYQLKTVISNGVSVLDNEQFQTGDIVINGAVNPSKTTANIKSDFLNGSLFADGNLDRISKALRQQFNGYFVTSQSLAIERDSLALQLNAKLTPKPILTEVFFKGLERLDTITVNVNFDGQQEDMVAELNVPFAQYQAGTLDSLQISIVGSATDLKFSSGFASLKYSKLHIKKTSLTGKLQNQKLLLDFSSNDENEKLVRLTSQLHMKGDSLLLRVDHDSLVLNRNRWSVPKDNQLVFAEKYLHFENMQFSNGNQEVVLTDAVSGRTKNHIGLLFKNFKLQAFLSVLNPDESLAMGKVQGNLILENPFGAIGLVADLAIDDLGVLNNRLGNLSVDASSNGFSDYAIDLSVKDGGLNLDLNGNYKARAEGAVLDLILDLKKMETTVLSGFFNDKLSEGEGFLSGRFELNGSLKSPLYEGNLTFHDAGLNITPLNTSFKVVSESIAIDESMVTISDFEIQDRKGDTFKVDGTIGTKQLLNPNFDLNFKANEFRLLDSSIEDNELYYGTASIDAAIRLKGNFDLPKLQGKLRIRKITELTYVVPEEQLDIEERDGVVIFVNRENPDAILTRKDERSAPDILQGFDINLLLEVADDAILTIVLDERTGDILQVAGDAALNLNLNPNGSVGLTGSYELKEGYYRTSLYNLVSRKFNIEPGSTIRWQGNPMDAKLDVTAIYSLETSAAPLMAAETSGVETSLASKYQQVLPFLVNLNVDGEITSPEISFNLDIPENSKGALGGAVYGKVQQLNEQETELNKQVFSLLALNRFFPNTVSDGSSGGAAGLARNNINKVLSNELNSFSEDVLGESGFELDFDLDSFTDYTGDNAQDRTQLNINASKKLFNDRLIVTAGSAVDVEGSAQTGQEETPIIGNVSLEYLITKNGRYRLKGFRKNQYVNVIDGQLMVTGLALIFNREFNAFSELFNPLEKNTVSGPKKKNESKKKKKDSNEQ